MTPHVRGGPLHHLTSKAAARAHFSRATYSAQPGGLYETLPARASIPVSAFGRMRQVQSKICQTPFRPARCAHTLQLVPAQVDRRAVQEKVRRDEEEDEDDHVPGLSKLGSQASCSLH